MSVVVLLSTLAQMPVTSELQSRLAGCFAAQGWAADVIREIGISAGVLIEAKFGRGHIPGMGGDSNSGANDLQMMLLAPGGRRGYLVLATSDRDGRVMLAGPFGVYALTRGRAGWSAGGGNGGLATYAAMSRRADALDATPTVRLRLVPTPGPLCKAAVEGH